MIKRRIKLQTENGVRKLDLTIAFDNADVDEATKMTIQTDYDGKEIVAVGTRYPFEDAYAELQNQLPDNVRLNCCVACRYGNLCPVGNVPDEVFCTKDVQITYKSDLFPYTEDDDERSKRSKHFSDSCEDFCPQEDGTYTYNDYLNFLEKPRLKG